MQTDSARAFPDFLSPLELRTGKLPRVPISCDCLAYFIMTRFFAVTAAVALVCSGCEKQDTSNGNSAKSATPEHGANGSPPREMATKLAAMVYVPEGDFIMGDDHGNPDEAPAHKVKLSAFWMDKYEVTHEMFTKVQLPDPSHWQDSAAKPVERVRWRDAKVFCNERSLLEGLRPCYNEKTADWECDFAADGYRLPTE